MEIPATAVVFVSLHLTQMTSPCELACGLGHRLVRGVSIVSQHTQMEGLETTRLRSNFIRRQSMLPILIAKEIPSTLVNSDGFKNGSF